MAAAKSNKVQINNRDLDGEILTNHDTGHSLVFTFEDDNTLIIDHLSNQNLCDIDNLVESFVINLKDSSFTGGVELSKYVV